MQMFIYLIDVDFILSFVLYLNLFSVLAMNDNIYHNKKINQKP